MYREQNILLSEALCMPITNGPCVRTVLHLTGALVSELGYECSIREVQSIANSSLKVIHSSYLSNNVSFLFH